MGTTNKDNIKSQVKRYLNLPEVMLGRKLWNSVGYLANIEMMVFAKLGLSWEEILIYNPKFNSSRTAEDYENMVKFVTEESEACYKIEKKFLKIVSELDKICDKNKDSRGGFRKVEKQE